MNTDKQDLREWLENIREERIHEFASLIAHRAAMRVLPMYWRNASQAIMANIGEKVPAKCLHVLRAHLLCSLFGTISDPKIEQTAKRHLQKPVSANVYFQMEMASDAGSPGDESSSDIDCAGASAISALSLAHGESPDIISAVIHTIGYFNTMEGIAYAGLNDALLANVIADCRELDASGSLKGRPLWLVHTEATQRIIDSYWKELKAGQSWNSPFWTGWYENVLEGREQDWEMIHEIALIPDEKWERGADHIDTIISMIIEKYRLLREVQELRGELVSCRQNKRPTIGHNNPPQEIDEHILRAIGREYEIVLEALGEVEEELSKPMPLASVLNKAGREILEAIKNILAYGARLSDTALMSGAKAFGASAGTGMFIYLVDKGPDIQELAKRIIEFAQYWLR